MTSTIEWIASTDELPDAPLFWARFPEPPQPRAKKGKRK